MTDFCPSEYIDRVVSGQPELPIFMEILPVNPCNHRCVFCISADYRMDRDRLPWAVIRRVIAEIGASEQGYLRICGGGEPLLHTHAEEMLLFCKWSDVTTDLTTNGSLLRGPVLEAAMEACKVIRVSLNGGNPQAYAATHRVVEKEFFRVLDNLKAIKAHELRREVRLELSMVICPENENSISDFLTLARDLGVDKAVLITDTEGDPEMVDRHLRLAQEAIDSFSVPENMRIRLRRSQPDTFFETDLPSLEYLMNGVVAANGDVYPSCHHVGMPEHKLGNVTESISLHNIFTDPEVQRHRLDYALGKARKLEKFVISEQNLDLVRGFVARDESA
jgi:MoaA/NifB/PqqE/SkfB family radical SAM enzyme